MKILIVGNGGREHAIAWKVAQNPKVEKIYCAPGNGGTALMDKCENIDIEGIDSLADFAQENIVNLTIVGPEVPLVNGIVDHFKERGLKIFGPSKKAAALEGSKSFSKDFMKKYGVKTAAYEVFYERDKALQYLEVCNYPIVIKADGLAAGKGVVICENYSQAEDTIIKFMVEDMFGDAGKKVVIEEFLVGVEASILSITDGKVILPFISSKDHKQIYDEDKGPNTGGMGAIAPNPYVTEEVMEDFNENILKPTLKGINEENFDFRGIIFFGVMITKKGAYLLEYNVRMGDPETQAVLPLMDSDLVELIEASLNNELSSFDLKWKKGNSCCVVAVSEGYPGKYEKGFKINMPKEVNSFVAAGIFKGGNLLTNGGRVLCTYAVENNLEDSINKAYKEMGKIDFHGIYFRKDIGKLRY
ncbi:phosphoribosylamine--glycine ligase [Clostridium tetanomorphum]|uniref:Phosphoribosylamine--glycine ligase n=1 Tax=Clostridium tetanomorphum TaxID=1553 RepID=A0A923J1D0_CLOTT|nr:phosphoribosylamine--glycine ligase [Clostridium tetanomorphum]KAJ50581.1 phosphoribosylamine--glycine ligase [Clostridium tetanomorphum DSM 665]MBC2399042.1 phosphoribosylamine--glycine ligase [Clostridium tetanomorphum]MBP1862655.1 phosphoribosylamine--glycine ligase [Clostridium tetanomorphum]NRS85504.1 phosphoribosylamine--glycine ligase [Clostridium tetanomorphum]NRZ98618.1 phosphoribosylamine--glycine ligase [Clostridium tetanomorphum]